MTPTEMETQTSLKSGPDNQKEALPDVPAAHQAAVQRAIESALYAAQHDRTLRVPRSEEDRANGFAGWLARKRRQHEPMMQTAIAEAFANVAPLDDMTAQKYMDCCVWPAVEFWLLHHWALRAQASSWSSRHYRDSTTIGMPEAQGAMWRIPLGVYQCGENLGQIMLDCNGNVIEHLTSTLAKLTEKSRATRIKNASSTSA